MPECVLQISETADICRWSMWKIRTGTGLVLFWNLFLYLPQKPIPEDDILSSSGIGSLWPD